jgi:hypothetical protein
VRLRRLVTAHGTEPAAAMPIDAGEPRPMATDGSSIVTGLGLAAVAVAAAASLGLALGLRMGPAS